jgi:hypothetical protein
MSFDTKPAVAWLQANIHRLIPRNVNRYHHGAMTTKLGTNVLGLKVDLSIAEGTVEYSCPDFYIIKTGRANFKYVDPAILRQPLIVGSKVRITPYLRRRFNGTLFTDPERTERDGFAVVNTYAIGQTHAEIPIERPTVVYTEQMLQLLHHGKCTDGIRVISNLLVDCNAKNFKLQEPPKDDPESGEPLGPWVDPQIRFDCKTDKFTGEVTVGVDVGSDTYYVELKKPDSEGVLQPHTKCENILFDQLAETLEILLCDGNWRYAEVTVLKAAAKRKTSECLPA